MKVLLGLGGNVGDVAGAFRVAARVFSAEGVDVCARSGLYLTVAVGPEQKDFLNGALLAVTGRSPRSFLGLCAEIERGTGRRRESERRWGPRSLDLDILLIENLVCRGPILEVPHPRLAERAFALIPAADIAPEWVHPALGKSLKELAKAAVEDNPSAVESRGSDDWS